MHLENLNILFAINLHFVYTPNNSHFLAQAFRVSRIAVCLVYMGISRPVIGGTTTTGALG